MGTSAGILQQSTVLFNMLRYIALLSLCVPALLGADCDPPPSDDMSCSVLDKKMVVLEEAIEEAECNMGVKSKGDMSEVCDMLTMEAIPACFQQEDEDAEECLDRMATNDIVKKCECKAYEEVMDDLLEALEVYCEDDRDSKSHRSPGELMALSRLWRCGPRQNPRTPQCIWFFQNEAHLTFTNSFFLANGNTNAFLLNQALRNRGNTNPLTRALILNQVVNRGNNRDFFTNAFLLN